MFNIKYFTDDCHAVFEIIPFSFVGKTDGEGLWSDESREVISKSAEVYVGDWALEEMKDKMPSFGELRVYFNMKSWNIDKFGLIYTDEGWLKDLRNYLISLGFSKAASKDVDYSEQGMQSDNYVSLDVGKEFLKEIFTNLTPKDNIKLIKEFSLNDK